MSRFHALLELYNYICDIKDQDISILKTHIDAIFSCFAGCLQDEFFYT